VVVGVGIVVGEEGEVVVVVVKAALYLLDIPVTTLVTVTDV